MRLHGEYVLPPLTVIGQSIQSWARAPAIAFLGRNILGPLPTRTGVSFWDNVSRFEIRG